MTTETGWAIAQSRLAFLYLFLQELQLELMDGGYSGALLDDKIFNRVHLLSFRLNEFLNED